MLWCAPLLWFLKCPHCGTNKGISYHIISYRLAIKPTLTVCHWKFTTVPNVLAWFHFLTMGQLLKTWSQHNDIRALKFWRQARVTFPSPPPAPRTKISEISQSCAIPGCFIFIGCWIEFYPDTTDTGFFLIGYCVAHFLFFDWLISGSSQQNSRGALDSSTVRAARLMLARCGTFKH